MNSVNLVGNLVADPELRYTPSGKAVCEFRVAADSGYGEKKQTEFVNCVAWEKQAEKVAEYGRRGREIAILNGRIQTKSWQDKTSGEKRYKTEVICNQVVVGHPREETPAASFPSIRAPQGVPKKPEGFEVEQDDIPF